MTDKGMTRAVYRLAAKLDAMYQRQYAEYLEACEADRRQGYRPHYCEHGTSNWTDWDNICGPCEDGLSMRDGLFRMRYALDEAHSRYQRVWEIIALSNKAESLNVAIPSHVMMRELDRLLTV